MSKLSRAIKFIFAIWMAAFLLALPQAMQFSVVKQDVGYSCTVGSIFTAQKELALSTPPFHSSFADGEQLLCPCFRRVGFHLLLRPHDGDLCALRADWNEAQAQPVAAGAAETRLRRESRPQRAESRHQNAG